MDMGFIEANQKLTDIAPMVPERFKALGHQGWTAMPISGSPQWYTLVTSLILGVGIGCLAQPQLVVRFMMVESTKQLNRGVLIGCVFLIVTVGAIYHVGALSNLFFLKTEGVVASEAVKDMDKIIPLFINKAMPEWFGAVFMLCILSASMSTLSAQFHTMGAAFGADAFPKLGRSKNPNSTLGVRIGVLCSILVSYVICYTLSASIIARGTALFMGICAATFLPTYFCSLYWKGATRQGALASLWVGGLASLFAMLFLHKAEAARLRALQINSGVRFIPVTEKQDFGSMCDLFRDADVVVDALGGLADRQALEKAAAEKGVPVVSAGIAGLTGWCKAIFPGETGPASLLAGEGDRPTPDEILGNLAPTVFLAASLQAALVLQILTGKPVRREALFFDLEDGTFTQVVLDRRP